MNRALFALIIFSFSFSIILNGCTSAAPIGISRAAESTINATSDPIIITQEPIVITREVPVFVTPAPLARCAPEDLSDADEIRIGALLPLSDKDSFLAGFAMQTALNLAISHLNHAGGVQDKPVRLFVEDTMGDPSLGSERAERLITQDCVVGLVGIYHSRVALAVKEVAHQYGVPIIFSEPYHDAITEDLYPEVFRVAAAFSMVADSDEQWLSAVGDYNDDGRQSVVFVVDNNGFGVGRIEAVAERLQNQEIETATLVVNLPTDNFSAVIARIVSLDHIPDVIAIRFNTDYSLVFQRQLHEEGYGPTAGTLIATKQAALDSAKFWQQVPDGNYTIVERVGPWQNTITEQGRFFATEYQKVMNRWPESYAFAAYDSLLLLSTAIEDAESLAVDDLVTALEEINVELASGTYYFPYNSQNPPAQAGVPAYLWHQWPNPHLLLLQYTEVEQPSTMMEVLWPSPYSTTREPVLRPLAN